MFKKVYRDFLSNKKEIIIQENEKRQLKSKIEKYEDELSMLIKQKEKLNTEIDLLNGEDVSLTKKHEEAKQDYKNLQNQRVQLLEDIQSYSEKLKLAVDNIKLANEQNEVLKKINLTYKEKKEVIQKEINKTNIQTKYYKYYQDYITNDLLKLYISNFVDEEKAYLRKIYIDKLSYISIKDSTELLLSVLKKESFELSVEEVSEYIKYEFIRKTHNHMMKKMNLLSIYTSNKEGFLPKIFSVYGNKIQDNEMLYYLSLELLNRNIVWQYTSIDEFKELIKKEYNRFQGEKFYNRVTKRKNLVENNELITENLDRINLMTGFEFEVFLKKVFLKLGYNVVETKLTGDQGADLIINNDSTKYAVQAKRYKGVVGNTAVQEALAGKSYYNCDVALVVTSGRFTKSALELSEKADVILWDGEKLVTAIKELNRVAKEMAKPIVTVENHNEKPIHDLEYIKLQKEKQELKQEIEALKNNKYKDEKNLLTLYEKIEIAKTLKKYITVLKSNGMINKLAIETLNQDNDILKDDKSKKNLKVSKDTSNFNRLEKSMENQTNKIEKEIVNKNIIPEYLLYYDEYKNNSELNNLVRLFVADIDIYKKRISYWEQSESYKRESLELLTLLLERAEMEVPNGLLAIQSYIEYEILKQEFRKYIELLNSVQITGLEEKIALEKIFMKTSLKFDSGKIEHTEYKYGNFSTTVIDVKLISMFLHQNNVILTHKTMKELTENLNEAYIIAKHKTMIEKAKSL